MAIIMDGNGRWAEARGLPVAEGHRAGTRALRRTVEAAIDLGVELARRLRVLDRELDAPGRRGRRPDGDLRRDDRARAARPRRAGRPDALHRPARPRARRRCGRRWRRSRRRPPANDRLDLWIAFDYGGRAELVEAGAAARRGRRRRPTRSTRRRSPRASTRPSCPIRTSLIRTSGELRISNFLLWQIAYAELVFVDDALARLRRGRARGGARRVREPAPAVRRPMSR